MKGKISAEFLQKIKETVTLSEVVGEHVVLRKTGANHVGLCPFHSERSPSFSVNDTKQLYHCYGCKAGGDTIGFVQQIHGMSFMEAVEELAERARLPLPRDIADANADPEVEKRRVAAREKLATAHKLNRFAAAFYHQQVQRQRHIADYFRSRGAEGDLARGFYIGAAPPSWDALAAHLLAAKAPLPLAAELGLIKPSTKANARPGSPGYFDLFRNRAMFPILDMRGKVAGFGGRALPIPEGAPDVGGDSQPKYMNSPESLIFHKSKIAFGLYQAQKHVREKDEVILVEGYFDVLGMHAGGFQNAVATCGTALTPDHLHVFKRLSSKVTVLFDGDKAGISATERAMEVGLDQGLVLYGAVMPEGLDPDELVFDQGTGKASPEGIERLKAIVAASQPLLDTQIELEVRKATEGPEARTQALKRIGGWLGRFKDPVGREVRLQSVAGQLGVPVSLVQRAMGTGAASPGGNASPAAPGPQAGGAVRTQVRTQAPPPPSPAQRPARPVGRTAPRGSGKLTPREKVVLAALARGGRYSEILVAGRRLLPPQMSLAELFDYSSARAFVALLVGEPGALERFRQTPEAFLDAELDPQVRSIVTEALVAAEPPYDESETRLAISHCGRRALERFSHSVMAAIADAEAKKDAGLEASLKQEYLDVQRKMKEFTNFYDEA